MTSTHYTTSPRLRCAQGFIAEGITPSQSSPRLESSCHRYALSIASALRHNPPLPGCVPLRGVSISTWWCLKSETEEST